MSAAARSVVCVVCRNELTAPPAGGVVRCPQCGEENAVAPGVGVEIGGSGGADAAGACPVCGAAVAPNAAACGVCGELLGPLGPTGPAAARPPGELDSPTDATLVGLLRAAGRDLLRHGLLSGAAVAGSMILWTMLFVTQVLLGLAAFGFVAAVSNGRGDGAEAVAFLLGYGAAALAALPVNSAVPLGLANLHLAMIRGTLPRGRSSGEGGKLSPLWRTRGKVPMLLCGLLVLGLGAAEVVAVVWTAGEFDTELNRLAGGSDFAETVAVVGVAVPLFVLWTLFWPLPFVIVDRPDLGRLRPLRVCVRLARGGWGGRLAVSFLTAAAVVGCVFAWVLPLALVGPFLLLLMAHRYDREARALDEAAPPELDPDGAF